MAVLKETAAGKKLLSLAQDLLRGHFGFPGETSYLSQLLHVYCVAGPAPRSIAVAEPVWGARPGLSLAEDLSHLVASCSCKSFRQNGMCLHAYALIRCVAQDVERGLPSTGVRSLIASFGPPPAEEQLADLDRLLLGVESLPRAEQIAAWIIVLSRSALKVNVMTRRRLKNGTWGVPRSAPYDPVDILEASAIEQDRALSRRLIGVDFPRFPSLLLLEALAGHPHVHVALDVPGEYPPVPFNPAEIVERAPPFRVERQPAALTVREEGDLLAIHATFSGHLPAGEPFLLLFEGGIVGAWPAEQRLIVGRWEPEVAEVVRQILRLELKVPRAAGDALVMKLEALERRGTPILLPPALAGREVAADERVVLACEPIVPQGAAIAIGFRPIPGARRVEPGAAPARFNAMVGGERLTAIRRLDRERVHAERLISELALPLPEEEDPWRVLLATDGDVLEMVARLRDPAFADVVVEWPQDPPRLVGTPIRALRVSIQAKRDWFDVEGSIEIDGQVLALAELLSAAREGRRFVQVGQGRFVEIERTFQARLARLADLVQSERGGLSLARTIAPHAADAFEGFEVIAPVAWSKLLARVEECRTQTPELPAGFIGELRPYQLDGFRWLWRLARMGIGGCLADDMGLGKTVQAIAMLVERAPLGPQLVIAPTSVGFNWIRELARFAPGLRARDLRGADRKSMLSQAAAGDVIVASYGLLRQEIDLLGEKRFTTVVLDEAQAFKNFETQTARAVRALQSDWSIALTGTPVENHLGELYSLVHTVAPGLLGSWDRFAKSFGRPIERERRSDRQQALSRLLRPFILRRTKGEVLKDLPSRTEIRLDALLSRPERALYEASRLDTVARLSAPRSDGPRDARFEVLAALTRLRQLASHARMVEPQAPRISAKLAVLLEQLDEVLDEGHTALIFSQFTRQLRLIREVLEERKIESLYLDGETPAAERERLVHAFQAGGAKVFLVSLKAGGTGLNLTAADYVFLMDPWWNPAVEDQAADRAHRIGQTRPVTIVRIVAKGTVEEKVLALHAEKRKLVAGILDGADLAGRLSTDDLIDLLKEGAQDVEDEPADLRVASDPPAPRAKAAGQRPPRR